MHRPVIFAALSLVAGCGGPLVTSADGGDETTGTAGEESSGTSEDTVGPTTDSTGGCTPGTQGCTCTEEGSCDPGLSCVDATCALASCGNGIVDEGEACDQGPNNADDAHCKSDCTVNVCGDGAQGPAEGCDDGNTVSGDGCSASCVLETCGNGTVDLDEECDDGNTDEGDACTTLCMHPTCGDGVLSPGLGEECDDANPDNQDACPNDCTLPVCGDDVVEGSEQCDDGDFNGGGISPCSATCTANLCGDDYLFPPFEECEDGPDNGNGTSPCTANCKLNTCGDGYLHQPTEECDDTNALSGDGCSQLCDEELPIIAVTAGFWHTCALRQNGRVRCWGWNEYGQLGHGTTQDIGDNEPPSAVGDVEVGGTVVQLSAGVNHTCAVLDTGALRCWGQNSSGQLGYGHTDNIGDNETPAAEEDVDVGGSVVQVGCGDLHTCALLADGTLRCWGSNNFRQLGNDTDETIGDNEVPSSVAPVAVGGTIAGLAAGGRHNCVLLDTGAVRCWGAYVEVGYGCHALGYGGSLPPDWDHTPASAGDVDIGGLAVHVAAGSEHTCVILDGGSVRCWGTNDWLQLGYGMPDECIGDDETPASVPPVDVGAPVTAVEGGSEHTCALVPTGGVRCWGSGAAGYPAEWTIGDDESPASAGDVFVGGLSTQIAADGLHTCALLEDGAVRCWGNANSGQLGYGNTDHVGFDAPPADAGDVPIY